jgi:hypothetical protein
VNLRGYKGKVTKSATVSCDDPKNSQIKLVIHATVKTLIDVLPTNSVSFRGLADQLPESTIDIVGAAPQSFHIHKVESNLDEKISFQLETIADGKHYRLKVSNREQQGGYAGFIKCYTDLPEKPEIIVRILGNIEGDISVGPKTILIGKLTPQGPVQSGQAVVRNNRKKSFQIKKLTYNERFIQVDQQTLSDGNGFSLQFTPILENIPPGAGQKTALTIETDVSSSGPQEVQIQIVNRSAPLK